MTNQELSKLKKSLANEKSDIRKKALAEIKNLKPEEALPILVSMLERKNDDIIADITKAMFSFKDAALPYLVKALSSEDCGE